MNQTRRNLLLSSLFGGGYLGIRALAAGIPASVLLGSRTAHAGPCTSSGALPQYVIFTTSGNGDPLNANCPGSYGVSSNLYNCPAAAGAGGADMTPMPMAVGGQMYQAAAPWAQMKNLDPTRTQFWHMMTNTVVHPFETNVLKLQGAIYEDEMFASFLSKNTQSCLNTIQPQPVSVGAASPSEALSYQGGALPTIPPSALQKTLVLNATSSINQKTLPSLRASALTNLQSVLYPASSVTGAQNDFVTTYLAAQTALQKLDPSILASLADLSTESSKLPVQAQIDAAVALIRMNITGVVAIHIPFGGDNHHDPGYAAESLQTTAACQSLDYLLGQLQMYKTVDGRVMSDAVTIVSLNVFGRTLEYLTSNGDGRQHNLNHHVSFVIGKPFKGGVYGAVTQLTGNNDFGCVNMNAKTGAGTTTTGSGVIDAVDTFAAWGMTVATGVGVDPAVVMGSTGISTTTGAGAKGTATVVTGALA